jgi:hypothetical protein
VCLRVDKLPAFAAVGGVVPLDVECAADEWEARDILEVRVYRGEVWARSAVGVAIRVVVFGVPRCWIGGKHYLLVVIHGVVHVLGRGNIATCGHGTSGAGEEEYEYECGEVDHGVVKAQWRRKDTGITGEGLRAMMMMARSKARHPFVVIYTTLARYMLAPTFAP